MLEYSMDIINHNTSVYILGLGHGTCAVFCLRPHGNFFYSSLSPLLCFLNLAKIEPKRLQSVITLDPGIIIVVITPPLSPATQPVSLMA